MGYREPLSCAPPAPSSPPSMPLGARFAIQWGGLGIGEFERNENAKKEKNLSWQVDNCVSVHNGLHKWLFPFICLIIGLGVLSRLERKKLRQINAKKIILVWYLFDNKVPRLFFIPFFLCFFTYTWSVPRSSSSPKLTTQLSSKEYLKEHISIYISLSASLFFLGWYRLLHYPFVLSPCPWLLWLLSDTSTRVLPDS